MVLEPFSCFNSKTGSQRIHICVGIDLRRIEVEFLPPNELGLLTLVDDSIKELPKYVEAIALTNTGQARMVGKRLAQIIVG